MTDKGIVEIGGKRTEVAREDIRKLKISLEDLCIMHIIDDVTFESPWRATSAAREIEDAGIYNCQNEGGSSPENDLRFNGKFEIRELIIPYLYQIDYMSLIQLNNNDVEFLGNLLYGPEN